MKELSVHFRTNLGGTPIPISFTFDFGVPILSLFPPLNFGNGVSGKP